MARKKIVLKDSNGKEYTLEFTADTIKKLEQTGRISFGRIEDYSLTFVEELFYGAFEANHKKTTREQRKELWENIAADGEDGEEIQAVLLDMAKEAIEELSPKGNLKWKAVS